MAFGGRLSDAQGSSTTCWRRLRQWDGDGTLLALWRALLAVQGSRFDRSCSLEARVRRCAWRVGFPPWTWGVRVLSPCGRACALRGAPRRCLVGCGARS
jgi:hypothetical protein